MTKNKSSDCGQWLPKKSNCEYTHVNVNVDYQFACASKFALTTFLLRRVLSLHVSVCVALCVFLCVCVLVFKAWLRANGDHPFFLDHPTTCPVPANSRLSVSSLRWA